MSAAVPPAARFVAVYQPGGTVLDRWRPTGTESDFTLSPILAPFERVKDRIVVLGGIDMPSAVGEQNQAGMVAWLTGTPQGRDPVNHASLEQSQLLAQCFSRSVVARPILESYPERVSDVGTRLPARADLKSPS